MPWKKADGGFTTAKGGFVKNPKQYEALKGKYGKARAAAITNAGGNKSGKKGK